jgi:hypothetical protein
VTLTVTIPVRTENVLNGSHRHWSVRAKARKEQRRAAALACLAAQPTKQIGKHVANLGRPALPAVILLTRVAPSRGLDDDSLPASMKAIRDGVADWLGLADDRDARVRWIYDQRRGAKGEYAVEVTIRPMTADERRVYGVPGEAA